MGKIISYLIGVLLTLFFSLMYNSRELIMLFLAEILIPFSMLIFISYPAGRMKVKMTVLDSVITRGEGTKVALELDNPTSWILPKVAARIRYKNMLLGTEGVFVMEGLVGGKSRVRLTCPVKSDFCGKILLTLDGIRVYDYMHFFSVRKRKTGSEELAVLPKGYETFVNVSRATREFPVEGEEYDKERKGDDPSEIFQIREYRAGDRPQRIHWKLSARSEELLVKEYSRPLGCAVVLFLDFRRYRNGGDVNGLLEIALSVSLALLAGHCMHFLCWFDREAQKLIRARIENTDDIYVMLEPLIQIQLYQEEVELEHLYRDQYPGENYSTGIRLNLLLELYLKESLWVRFRGEGLEDELQGMELTV